jgi:hypothetical protein
MKKSVKKSSAAAVAAAPKSAAMPPASVQPVIAKAAPVKSAARPTPPAIPTTIEAKVDVGFGNSLFIRGQGAGLSWDQGKPLTNVDSKTWRLQVPAAEKLTFKLLLNDSVWSQGEDLTAAPGARVEVRPTF